MLIFYKKALIGEIDGKIIEQFKDMLLETKSNSTAYAYLTSVYMAYQVAINDNYPNKDAFSQVSLIKHKRELQKSKTPLTLEELKRLYQDYMNFKNNKCIGNYPVHYFPALQKFLFLCFTGLRYSDGNSLKYGHLKKTKNNNGNDYWYIEKVIQKTKKLEIIPLLPQAYNLIDWKENPKTNDFVFKQRCIGSTNAALENIGKINNVNEKITTHTARHTFSSLCIEFGMRREVIQKVLGHSSERMTERYAKVKKETMMMDLEKNWANIIV